MHYIVKRLGFYLLAAFVAVTVNFFLPRLTPGDPAQAIFATYGGTLDCQRIAQPPRRLRALRRAPRQPVCRVSRQRRARGFRAVPLAIPRAGDRADRASQSAGQILLGLVAVALSFIIGCGLGALAAWRRGESHRPHRAAGPRIPEVRSHTSSSPCCCSTWLAFRAGNGFRSAAHMPAVGSVDYLARRPRRHCLATPRASRPAFDRAACRSGSGPSTCATP